jgi:hypothetical protein
MLSFSYWNYEKKVRKFKQWGQQCHQYQQRKQTSDTSNYWTHKKKTTIYDIGNPGSGLGQA